jgi:hypothetical protein
MNLMRKLRKEEHQVSKIKIPGLHLVTYCKVVIPGKEEWASSTRGVMFCIWKQVFVMIRLGETRRNQASVYEKTWKASAKEIPNACGLITNYLMAVFVIVGLDPLWFAEEHTVNTTSSKLIDYFVNKKGLAKGKPAAQRFLDSLSLALEHQPGTAVTCKYSENIGCNKAFHLSYTEGSDKTSSVLEKLWFRVCTWIIGLWVEGFGCCRNCFSILDWQQRLASVFNVALLARV